MVESDTLPLADITEVALAGEPGSDKAYRVGADGQVYRVRVRLADQIAPAMDATGGVSPTTIALDITMTMLDADGAVVRDDLGRVVVAAQTRWTIRPATLESDGYDAEAALRMVIRNNIYLAERRRVASAATQSYLTGQWAVQPDAVVEVAPDPVAIDVPPPPNLAPPQQFEAFEEPEATAGDFGLQEAAA